MDFCNIQGIAALVGFLVGFIIAILFIGISGIALLWLYGSFWTTALIVFLGGDLLDLSLSMISNTFLSCSLIYIYVCIYKFLSLRLVVL